MDQTLVCYVQAMEYLKEYTEITPDEYLLESDEDIEAKEAKNESALKRTCDALIGMIQKLIGMVKNAIASFKEFLGVSFMDDTEKKRYAEFKDFVKRHPELGKEKVTIDDWRVYEKEYDEALKKLEEEAKKPNPSEPAMNAIVDSLQATINGYLDKGKTIGKRAAMVTTLDAAIDAADSNVTVAKGLNFALQNELIDLTSMEEELGKKETYKFVNKVNKAAKNSLFHKLKVTILKKKEQTLRGVLKKQTDRILSFANLDDFKAGKSKLPVNYDSIAKGMAKNTKFSTKVLGGPKETARTAKEVVVRNISSKLDERKFKKDVRTAKGEFGNLKHFITGK